MKKKKTWLFILPLLLCLAATALYAMLFVWNDDHTPPVITLDAEEIQISVNASEAELLRGVTAQDDRDGDVTADMVVEKISNMTDDHTATVTYAAFDKSGNVSKATRKLHYIDYTEPRFGQARALVFQAGTSPDVLSFMTAEDAIDGDLSRQVKGTLVSDTASLSYAGVHQIDFRMTNSMGHTVHLTLPVEIYEAGAYNATVNLSEYLVYVKKDAEFNAQDYLKHLTVGNTAYSLRGDDPEIRLTVNGEVISGGTGENGEENGDATGGAGENDGTGSEDGAGAGSGEMIGIEIIINDPVDTGTPGVYSVTYTVTMNRYVGYTRLNVVVE